MGGSQRGQDEFVGEDGALDQRGEDPAEGVDLIRLVVLAARACADGAGQFAANAGVQSVHLLGRGNRLGARAEEHGVDDAEGGVKAADGVIHEVGMMHQRGRDPGMSQLQQSRASGAKEDRGLAVDAPGQRIGAEEAEAGLAGKRIELGAQLLDVRGQDVLRRLAAISD